MNLLADGHRRHVEARGDGVVLVLHGPHDVEFGPGRVALGDHRHGDVSVAYRLLDRRRQLGRAGGHLEEVVHGVDLVAAVEELLVDVLGHGGDGEVGPSVDYDERVVVEAGLVLERVAKAYLEVAPVVLEASPEVLHQHAHDNGRHGHLELVLHLLDRGEGEGVEGRVLVGLGGAGQAARVDVGQVHVQHASDDVYLVELGDDGEVQRALGEAEARVADDGRHHLRRRLFGFGFGFGFGV